MSGLIRWILGLWHTVNSAQPKYYTCARMVTHTNTGHADKGLSEKEYAKTKLLSGRCFEKSISHSAGLAQRWRRPRKIVPVQKKRGEAIDPHPRSMQLVPEDSLGWRLWRLPSLTDQGKRNGNKCRQNLKCTFLSANQRKAFTKKRDKAAKCNNTPDMWVESTSTVSPSKPAWSHTCRDYMTH